MSILLGINTAFRALLTQQQALNTTTHNIANAQTPGFSRQQAVLETTDPYTVPGATKGALAQQVGTGVTIREVRRIRDLFLDKQFRQRNETLGYWEIAGRELRNIETLFAEPSDNGLGHMLGQLWNSFRDLANDPRNVAIRLTLREQASDLAAFIRNAYAGLTDQRRRIDAQLLTKVDTINSIGRQINALNEQVTKVLAVGDTPNDLIDRRDLLIDELSKMIKITAFETDRGAVSITIGGIQLVGPGFLNEIKPTLNAQGYNDLKWAHDNSNVTVLGGEVRAFLDTRDTTIPARIAELESLADALITQVNTQHQLGFGLGGLDVNGGAPGAGVDFFGDTDGTAASAADTDNAAKIDIYATIKAAGGENHIAAALTLAGVPGDSDNANALAAKQFVLVMSGNTATMEEFYRGLIATLGVQTQEATREFENQSTLVRHVQAAKTATSGVSLDEEATNMIKFQRAYEGAARMVTAFDEMLDTLINRMGLVGRG